jgi:hypothetical protein
VDDTPNSLIERGFEEQGKAVLRKIRGVENVEPEFQDILKASKVAVEVKSPFKDLVKPHNRPPLIIALCMQVTTTQQTDETFILWFNQFNRFNYS